MKLIKNISTIEKDFTEKQTVYTQYLAELNKWKKKLEEIVGDEDKKDTIKYYEKWDNYLKNQLQKDYDNKLKERKEISKIIVELLTEKMKVYPDLYSYAKEFSENKASEFQIDLSDFLQFDSKISLSNSFNQDFFNYINQKYAGTFYTSEKGDEQVQIIKNKVDYNSLESIIEFPNYLINGLRKDLSKKTPVESDFEAQILPEKKLDLYNYIFGFTYLEPRFNITFAGKTISHLSPGEKGNLLLIFYLLIDNDRRPIIIDQPEENLDNETVALRLAPFIKKVKDIRQIIIVTHNPNIAVVCDSEQIIQASMDKKNNNLVSYEMGSIENLGIREQVIKVLEGTRPAFNNRKNKYSI